MLRAILDSMDMSLYKLEKTSGISHATLNDIYHERTNPKKISGDVLDKLAEALHMSMDELYATLTKEKLRILNANKEFDLFKSNICHDLKRLGDKEFMKKYVSNHSIDFYFDNKEYDKALYMLSIIDYLFNKHGIPLIEEYSELREEKLDRISVPQSVWFGLKTNVMSYDNVVKNSIPEFYKHNIIEGDLYNVN